MDLPPESRDEDAAPSMRWFLFGLSGRISRMPFVLATLFQVAVLGISLSRLMLLTEGRSEVATWGPVLFVSMLASVWITVATAIKRLHDINIPGAVVLCLFVPAVSVIAYLVLCFWPGTPGPNSYGDDYNRPKD
mgnify:CR=1 FL=1